MTQSTYAASSRLRHLWLVLILSILLGGVALLPMAAPQASASTTGLEIDADWGKMPLYFISNQGQVDEAVSYYVQGTDKTLYFTPECLTFSLAATSEAIGAEDSSSGQLSASAQERWTVRLDYLGAEPIVPQGQEETDMVISYFEGEPEDWNTGIPTYASVIYSGLWEGIDLVYRGTQDQLKQEFILQPGADPADIQLSYRGATLSLTDEGDLKVSTPLGGFTDAAPVAYQVVEGQGVEVPVSYVLGEPSGSGAEETTPYGFSVGEYDPALPLIIDPAVLVYCGYIGGSGDDSGQGIAVDSSGCAYLTGYAESDAATFPDTTGPDTSYNGDADAFVAKVSADGSALVYCGYIGGGGGEYGRGIAVDSSGCAYVCGYTFSTELGFPVTMGSFDTTQNGYGDAFVAKVSADGTSLVYCGYIGGDESDFGSSIKVDSGGCAYVVGQTESAAATFPETTGSWDETYNDDADAFVAKVAADGSALVYCGYLGGNNVDDGCGIAVDSSGCVYVCGYTESTEASFPVSGGPSTTHSGGSRDAYVAKVNAAGTALDYCGYVGGNDYDEAWGIAVDSSGCAYITGSSDSTGGTFPTTPGSLDASYNGGTDAFVAKVNSSGTSLVYCGYIGGSSYDVGDAVAVDSSDNVYVAGNTSSSIADGFPVTDGLGTSTFGNTDGFVAKVNAAGTELDYCAYIGGTLYEEPGGIALDSSGCAYVSGETNSAAPGFPATVGPDVSHNGSGDAFVAKIAEEAAPPTRYEQDNADINYQGPWVQDVYSPYAASGWSYSYADQPGCSTNVAFTGTHLKWVTRITPWSGIAKVVLDAGTPGEAETMVDTWHWTDLHKQTVYDTGTLPNGPHTVSIYWTGEKRAASWYHQIYTDAFDIMGTLDTAFIAPPLQTWRYQESDSRITYLGDWSTGSTSSASGGSYAATSQAGAMAVVQFSGTKVALIGKRCPWYGQAKVIVDPLSPGQQVATVDFYSSNWGQDWQEVVYTSPELFDGQHIMTIECLDESSQPEPIGTSICVDALHITGYVDQAPASTRVDDIDAAYCVYKPCWSHWDYSGYWAASADTYAYTDQDECQMGMTFEGTFASWVACTSNTKGKALVTLDPGPGEQTTIVDLYSPSTEWKQNVYSTGLLDYGVHTLVIKCLYEKNPASVWYTVNVDAFDVLEDGLAAP